MRQLPKPGEIYRHFKGCCYRIITLARDSETMETLVIYQALYGANEIYARELSMFMSPVDRQKYPDAPQELRFELLSDKSAPPLRQDAEDTENRRENRETPQIKQVKSAKPARDPQAEVAEVAEDAKTPENTKESADSEAPRIDPGVFAYLDADSSGERLQILKSMKDRLTDEMIDTMAVAIDVEIGPGDIIERYEQLKYCLATKERFECRRFR